MYKAKLIENTVAQTSSIGENGILENVTITAPLKHISKFRRSLEMPLINCKVKLKLKWTKYCVLSALGTENDDADSDYIIFTVEGTKFISL